MISVDTTSTPIISVVMSIYEEPEEWLRQSIESILNQTFSDFEFIIINDNPQRKLNDVLLKEYQKRDDRIVIISNDENIGLTKSLNKGLKIAKGEFIARMDGDDISYLDRFEKQLAIMESHPEIIVCGTNVEYIGLTKKRSTDWIHDDPDKIIAQLVLGTCMAHPTTMIRKIVLQDNSIQYDEDYLQAQDLKLWFELKEYGLFYNISEVLFKYRISKVQVSTRKRKNQNSYSINLRRNFIENFINSKGCIHFKIPDNVTLKFLKEFKLIEKNIILSSPEKNTRLSRLIFKNIIIAIYLSIKEENFKAFVYFLFSGDIIRIGSNLKNVLRIFEWEIFPNKKPPRL